MAHHLRRTGICLIRIEAQDTSCLITVRRNLDIGGNSPETVTSFSEVDPALDAARKFLEQFAGSMPSP